MHSLRAPSSHAVISALGEQIEEAAVFAYISDNAGRWHMRPSLTRLMVAEI